MKTVGELSHNDELKYRVYAVPVGVIAGLIPSTNPTSTCFYKAEIAVKAGNAIVFSPHPTALRCIMNPKGKLLNVAFSVSAAFVFGDHLGFTAGANPEMITPMIIGKLTAGITALMLANWLSPKLLAKITTEEPGETTTEA